MAAFSIGGVAGGFGHKHFFGDPVIVEKDKEITTKSEKATEWKNKYDALKEENTKLKEVSDTYDQLVKTSEVNENLDTPGDIAAQLSRFNDWIQYGRCMENCLSKTDDDDNWASGVNESRVALVDYFTKPKDPLDGSGIGNRIDPNVRDIFRKIFNGENPVANFESLDEEYKKIFLEAAVKYMAAVEAAFCGGYWKDKFSSNFGGDEGKETDFKKYHDLVNKEWA